MTDLSRRPSIRLTGGATVGEGLVEVYYNNQWGTICNSGWSVKEATVVCHQLGYDGEAEAVPYSTFGVGSSSTPIWLSNVVCGGYEDYISDCSHNDWQANNCNHYQDVGVICTGEDNMSVVFSFQKCNNKHYTVQRRLPNLIALIFIFRF